MPRVAARGLAEPLVMSGKESADIYDYTMRRGWLLAGTFLVVVITGTAGWWWGSPGQVWWMNKKWEWWVVPRVQASPNGTTFENIVDALNPQWDRLIHRGFVTPYCRVWDPAPTEEKIKSFGHRLEIELHCPLPDGTWGTSSIVKWKDGKQVAWSTSGAQPVFHVTLLIPPDQHRVVDQIARTEFGSTGKADDRLIPQWWLAPPPLRSP